MKTTELMIGDWVIGSLGDRGRVVAIDDEDNYKTHHGSVKVEYSEDFAANGEWVDKILPIPLAPEDLERNGFHKDEMYHFFNIDEQWTLEYYAHEHRLRLCSECVDEWQNGALVRDILFQCQAYYVHEFQHALRMCGFDKLADDFKA